MMRPDPVEYSGESMTKQAFRKECDINEIVARARAGQPVQGNRAMPRYMDVSEVGDYKSALDMIRKADAFFEQLPARVRESFGNDPARFLDGMDTDEGRAKLEELGLLPKVPETVTPAGVTPPA